MEAVFLVMREDGKYWHGHADDDMMTNEIVSFIEGKMEPMPPQFDQMCRMLSMQMKS